uniref:Uncharacterized protein n=1 Tax=Caenorhabditis japonica TaxID=281687 RepID=A0A8R1HJF1_CAEJA
MNTTRPHSSKTMAQPTKQTKATKRIHQKMGNDSPAVLSEDESLSPFKRNKCPSSSGGQWNPTSLIYNNCYSSTTGVRLSQQECEDNLRNALKNKKKTNWYSVLELSDRDGIRGTATSELCRIVALDLFQNQERKRNTERAPRVAPISKNPAPLFDLEYAYHVDTVVHLPGARRLHVSSLLSDNIIKVLKAGFQIEDSVFALPALCAQVKSLIRNYINRERRKCLAETETRLKQFNEDYAENVNFQLQMEIIGNIVYEQENSTAATYLFEQDENIPISTEETVGSVHSE